MVHCASTQPVDQRIEQFNGNRRARFSERLRQIGLGQLRQAGSVQAGKSCHGDQGERRSKLAEIRHAETDKKPAMSRVIEEIVAWVRDYFDCVFPSPQETSMRFLRKLGLLVAMILVMAGTVLYGTAAPAASVVIVDHFHPGNSAVYVTKKIPRNKSGNRNALRPRRLSGSSPNRLFNGLTVQYDVSLAGHSSGRIPSVRANVWATYDLTSAFSASVGLRHTSRIHGRAATRYTGSNLLDLKLTWQVGSRLRVVGRLRSIAGDAYAVKVGTVDLRFGVPRAADIELEYRF